MSSVRGSHGVTQCAGLAREGHWDTRPQGHRRSSSLLPACLPVVMAMCCQLQLGESSCEVAWRSQRSEGSQLGLFTLRETESALPPRPSSSAPLTQRRQKQMAASCWRDAESPWSLRMEEEEGGRICWRAIRIHFCQLQHVKVRLDFQVWMKTIVQMGKKFRFLYFDYFEVVFWRTNTEVVTTITTTHK